MTLSPSSAAQGPFWSALLGAIIHTLLWIGVALWLTLVVQIWVPVFNDFRLKLPTLTQQTLSWSGFITDYPVHCGVGLLFLGVVDGLILHVLGKPTSHRVLRELWSGVVVGSAFAILAFSALALVLPALKLTEALQR